MTGLGDLDGVSSISISGNDSLDAFSQLGNVGGIFRIQSSEITGMNGLENLAGSVSVTGVNKEAECSE